MKSLKVRITFAEPINGGATNNPQVYKEFIASKYQKWLEQQRKAGVRVDDHGTADELAALPPMKPDDEKGLTVFSRLLNEKGERTDVPCIWDNHVRGYFKSAAEATSRVTGKAAKKAAGDEEAKKDASFGENPKAFKKTVDQCVFVFPRQIPLNLPEGTEITYYQRPLRAQTMQGERTTLACSEQVAADTTCTFEVIVTNDALVKWVKGLLKYGMLNGIGQHRNGGYGAFFHEILEEKDVDFDYIHDLKMRDFKIRQALNKAEAEDTPEEKK